jgi:predicted RNA binding protein YcfA (HicA-like mRNA interferase family)
MKLLRDINGDALARHLERRWGYVRTGQSGSHIKLRTESPSGHTVIVPAHKPMKLGTCQSILKDVASHKKTTIVALLEDF